MGSRYLTDLANVCRGAGLLVQEEPGWQNRSRSSGGYDSGRPDHVMVHHTASGKSSDGQPDVNYMTYSSENRPVANLYLARSGKVWVMAGGATNTNGSGRCPHCGLTDSMNTRAIGIEAGNDGVGEPWPASQQTAYVQLVGALSSHYGIASPAIRAHWEYAPDRKVDPAGPSQWSAPSGGGSANKWNMAAFRASVSSGGGDMPLSTDDLNAIALYVWSFKLDHPTPGVANTPASQFMYYMMRNCGDLWEGDAPGLTALPEKTWDTALPVQGGSPTAAKLMASYTLRNTADVFEGDAPWPVALGERVDALEAKLDQVLAALGQSPPPPPPPEAPTRAKQ